MSKKLSELTEKPAASKEALAKAKAAGAKVRAYDPEQLKAFVEGRITLGDLEGISKDAQYQMAKVGFDYLTVGKLDQAKKVFEGLLALDPYDAYFHTALGSIAQRLGQDDEAEKRYSRALEINPFSPSALANRGEIRLSKGRLEEAIDDLSKAIKEDPQATDPAVQRARALLATVKRQLEESSKDPVAAAAAAKQALQTMQTGLTPPPASKTPPAGVSKDLVKAATKARPISKAGPSISASAAKGRATSKAGPSTPVMPSKKSPKK